MKYIYLHCSNADGTIKTLKLEHREGETEIIGREFFNKLTNSNGISRQHLKISYLKYPEVLISDFDSKNGTMVEFDYLHLPKEYTHKFRYNYGHSVETISLAANHMLHIGNTTCLWNGDEKFSFAQASLIRLWNYFYTGNKVELDKEINQTPINDTRFVFINEIRQDTQGLPLFKYLKDKLGY